MNRRRFLFSSVQTAAGVALAITINEAVLATVLPEPSRNTLDRLRLLWQEIDNEDNRIGFIQLGEEAYADMWDEIYEGDFLKGHPNFNKLLRFQTVPLKVEPELAPDCIKLFVNSQPRAGFEVTDFYTVSRFLT